MEYVKNWADVSNNTLIFVGYQAEGTLGKKLQRGITELNYVEMGKPISLKIKFEIENCDGFSGHSDRKQLLEFVRTMEPRPEKIIAVHGEPGKCAEFARTLYKKYRFNTDAPMNLETIRVK